MPELPEVEVVRAGLAPAVLGSRVQGVEVRDPRSLKRHTPTYGDFEHLLSGAVLETPVRRGKFLWIPLSRPGATAVTSGTALALLAHLGMSGQMLVRDADAEDDRHVRVRLSLEHPSGRELRLDFADQRIFGSLAIDELIATDDGMPGGFGSDATTLPRQVAHISRDVLDPVFNDDRFITDVRRRSSAIKRILLDQQVVSGIGNIYADEALWLARLHPETPGNRLSVRKLRELLDSVREVLRKALAEGGTSFDAQYVNVNGQAGYFAHSLHAYGQTGKPCQRCGRTIVREAFMNRSSHFCPKCQRQR